MSIAIITGGSAGIGQSAARQLGRRGVGVILTYNTHQDEALETVAEIEKVGGTAVALPLEVGRSETFPAFSTAVSRTLADHWQVDVFDYLVNNAGFGRMSMFEDTTEELFDEFMRVILKGPYFLTQSLLPLLADGGAIVNTTSSSALASGLEAGYSAYASMKGGLAVLTRYLAKELGVRGIRVNSVAPGPTRTRIGNDVFDDHPEVIAPMAARTVLGRIGEPDDIGMVIASLLSEETRWITAQDIEVSGGYDL
jgi:NAD(P)-dependent dehydrogenase (short-subunit alcohol dehydrogenase family)